MTINTHLEINEDLCGRVTELLQGRCTLEFDPTAQMRADDRGLVHGGFIFGAADYAAMLAINDPHVVLAGAEVRFMKPARVGERLIFRAATLIDHPRDSLGTNPDRIAPHERIAAHRHDFVEDRDRPIRIR